MTWIILTFVILLAALGIILDQWDKRRVRRMLHKDRLYLIGKYGNERREHWR